MKYKMTKRQEELIKEFDKTFGERYLGYSALASVLKMYNEELDLAPKIHKKIEELLDLIKKEAVKDMKK